MSLKSSSFILPKVRMRSNLVGGLSLTWSCSVDLKNKSMRTEKRQKHEKKKLRMKKPNSPINVIHGIQENCDCIPRIHDNAVNRDMPIFVERMMIIDVSPPCGQTMVPFPHIEHLANKLSKDELSSKHGIETFIRL